MTSPPIRQTIMQSQSMASEPTGDEVALTVRPINTDVAGRQAMNTAFGEATVGFRKDSVSIIFQYGLMSSDVVMATSGTGVTSHHDSMAEVAVNSGAGSAMIRSRDTNRYVSGHEMVSQFTGIFENAGANINQYLGPLSGEDGACFGTSSGQMGAWHIVDSVATFYPKSDWNFDVCTWMNPALMNLFMVSYGHLGIAPIQYHAFNPIRRRWELVHELNFVNQQAVPQFGNPSMPVAAKIDRAIAGTLVPSIKTSSWRSGCVSGDEENNSSNRWFSHTRLDAPIDTGSSSNVFTIRVSSQFYGKLNHVICELGVATFVNDTNKTTAWYGTKGATITSGSPFTDVRSGSSVMQVSEGGYVTGGTRGPATVLKSGADRRTEVLGTGIIIYPGEAFTFECETGGGAVGPVSLSARWIERF